MLFHMYMLHEGTDKTDCLERKNNKNTQIQQSISPKLFWFIVSSCFECFFVSCMCMTAPSKTLKQMNLSSIGL